MKIFIDETDRDRWNALADGGRAFFQQRWDYGKAVSSLGRRVTRLEIRNGHGAPMAIAQALHRKLLVPVTLITQGPVWLDDAGEALRKDALRLLRQALPGLTICTFSDTISFGPAGALGFHRIMTPATSAILPLTGDLLGRMHGKWRNRLRRGLTGGALVRRLTPSAADLEWLLRLDHSQQRNRGYRTLPPAFTRAWATDALSPIDLWTAEHGDERIAAMLVLRHGNTATYHIGWCGDAGRAVSAHHLILYEAAKAYAAQGVCHLDLGLLDTETAPGLARFKLGSGAVPHRNGGTWLSLRPRRYQPSHASLKAPLMLPPEA